MTAFVAAILIASSCSSSDDPARPAVTEGSAPPALTAPSDAPPAASPETEAVLAAADLELSAEQATCLASHLEADTSLREGLGDDPSSSDRFPDLLSLVSDCIRSTTFAREFANGLQAQSSVTLTGEQLTCLAAAAAGWEQAETDALLNGALNPDHAASGATGPVLDALAECGIDEEWLTPSTTR